MGLFDYPVAFVSIVPVSDVVGVAGGFDEGEVDFGDGDSFCVFWSLGEDAGFGEGEDGRAEDGRRAVGGGDGFTSERADEGCVDDEGLGFDGACVTRPSDSMEATDGFGEGGHADEFAVGGGEGVGGNWKLTVVADQDTDLSVVEGFQPLSGLGFPFVEFPLGEDVFVLVGETAAFGNNRGIENAGGSVAEVGAGEEGDLVGLSELPDVLFDFRTVFGQHEWDLFGRIEFEI